MKSYRWITCLCLLGLMALPLLVRAAEGGHPQSPYFVLENGDPAIDRLPLEKTSAAVRISGVMADVVVTQAYRNDGSRPINARYVFPASTRAAVHGMTLTVGERRIRAQISEKEAARRTYEAAKVAGKSAALLEQHRPNVFSMDVANVMPGDRILVELHYSELLVPTEGVYEFVYPTVVGPRYVSPADAESASERWVASPYTHQGESPLYAFDIHARVATGIALRDLAVPSHEVLVDWKDANTAELSLAPTEIPSGGNRDFVLRYRLEGDRIESGLLLYAGERENFFLLLMQPPERVLPAAIPPREYVFVLDVSGSMNGFPLDTAKQLMSELIGGLRPSDRFNIVLFAGGSRLLAPRSLTATPENLQYALLEIAREQGGGGTELGAALQRALALPAVPGVARSTVIVTDGFIAADAAVFELIRASLGNSNIFTFGIGSSVNRALIEGMARAGNGEPFVVTQPSEAAAAATRFSQYVAAPVLTDITLAAQGFAIDDVEPVAIPDLFADRPLVIFGKWRGSLRGSLHVHGIGGDGAFEQSFDIAQAASSTDHPALRYLWARARVARLSDLGETGLDVQREVTQLGLDYELLTRWTSFVAVHERVRNDTGDAADIDQPLPLPQGVADSAIGRSVPEPELLLIGGLTWLLILRARRRRLRKPASIA